MWLPGLWKLPNRWAQRLAAGGRDQQAVRVIATYVRLRPGDPHGWTDLGDFLLRTKDFDEMARAMDEGLRRHPREGRLIYLLARARIAQGNLDQAETILTTPRPDAEHAFFVELGQVDLAIARTDWEHAVALGRRTADAIPPEWGWAKYELASRMISFRAADDLTERIIREASVGYPRKESRYGLGCITLGALIEKTRPVEAEKLFDEARSNWSSRTSVDEFLASMRRLVDKRRW